MEDDTMKSASAKAQIIQQLNVNHKDSWITYLEYYCGLPNSMAKSAYLESLNIDYLIIDASKTRYFVPLDPPLKALSEIEQRLVKMDGEAIESRVTVDEYRLPSGPYLIIFVLILAAWAMNYSGRNFIPGAFFYEKVLRGNQSLAKFFSFTQPLTLFVMISLHSIESIWFDWSRLSKHQVKRFGLLWCLWIGSSLLEGSGPIMRFDSVVRSKIQQRQDNLR